MVEAFDANGKSLGILSVTASPMMTPILMRELVEWTRDAYTDRQLHPLLIIGIFIVRFLAIHPFQDGNGVRLSRVVTTLLLLKSGYTYVPYSSLETVIEENKDGYYLALRRTQKSLDLHEPDWNPWLVFFLHSIQRQKKTFGNQVRKGKNYEKFSSPIVWSSILELAKEHGRITTKEIENYTKASRSTIKTRINELIEMKKLARNGKGRSTWYSLM